MAWVGLIHADRIGWGEAKTAALGYLLMAGLFLAIAKVTAPAPARDEAESPPSP
jgi:hypothetical protein